MNINLFDRTLKILARNHAARFLELAFPGEKVQLVGTLEDVELALPEQRVDFVHRVRHEGKEYLFHLEFQLEHQAEMPKRLFVYSALLTQQFNRPVVTLVLYLERRKAPLPEAYQVQFGKEVVNRFSYRTLRLWDYEEAIRSGEYRELSPLLVMLVREPDETVLARERELILEEADPHKRADLLSTAVMMAGRYFDKEFLWEFFQEEVEKMRGATFIEDWVEEGVQQGIQQGTLLGRGQESQNILTRILARKFGRLPVLLADRLEGLTLGQLEALIDAALDAGDLAAFEQELTAMAAVEVAEPAACE